jgi:gamma-glutamylcysteine synthetase
MAVINTFAQDAVDLAEPLTLDAAHARSCQAALADSEIGTVGLEIEAHLVDLRAVSDAVAWLRVEQATDAVRAEAETSAVTFEPGGQLELSGRPQERVASPGGARTPARAHAGRDRCLLAMGARPAHGLEVDPPGNLGTA